MHVSAILSFALLLVSPGLGAVVPLLHACDTSNDLLPVPANQTAIVRPSTPPSIIGIGVGTQNYTCSSATSKYASAGAVAELFDISCIADKSDLPSIEDLVYKAWISAPPNITPQKLAVIFQGAKAFPELGEHYFITNPITGTGISPKWDFTASLKNPNAFVVGAKVGDIPAPTGPNDVDWLSLNAVQGGLAKQIFRVATRGGQPPASCTPGSAPITVKYVAQYWFYGSSISR